MRAVLVHQPGTCNWQLEGSTTLVSEATVRTLCAMTRTAVRARMTFEVERIPSFEPDPVPVPTTAEERRGWTPG